MAKLKEMLMDILEDFDNRIPVSVIATKYDIPVAMVQEIIDEWSEAMAKS